MVLGSCTAGGAYGTCAKVEMTHDIVPMPPTSPLRLTRAASDDYDRLGAS